MRVGSYVFIVGSILALWHNAGISWLTFAGIVATAAAINFMEARRYG